ncbi:unnamed protein product [Parascedosporium putredinis]|uniref:Myb-like domain-containing protein n=1 Tax=Parascedosporium putredinis TaxID=1442378 RepID=A0A9P1HE02_9PEZI|nr:unnamed protein product [Parascedosporium putredinis]CAI8004792.1 unnamed protein product [Parascedosporium putredinis]
MIKFDDFSLPPSMFTEDEMEIQITPLGNSHQSDSESPLFTANVTPTLNNTGEGPVDISVPAECHGTHSHEGDSAVRDAAKDLAVLEYNGEQKAAPASSGRGPALSPAARVANDSGWGGFPNPIELLYPEGDAEIPRCGSLKQQEILRPLLSNPTACRSKSTDREDSWEISMSSERGRMFDRFSKRSHSVRLLLKNKANDKLREEMEEVMDLTVRLNNLGRGLDAQRMPPPRMKKTQNLQGPVTSTSTPDEPMSYVVVAGKNGPEIVPQDEAGVKSYFDEIDTTPARPTLRAAPSAPSLHSVLPRNLVGTECGSPPDTICYPTRDCPESNETASTTHTLRLSPWSRLREGPLRGPNHPRLAAPINFASLSAYRPGLSFLKKRRRDDDESSRRSSFSQSGQPSSSIDGDGDHGAAVHHGSDDSVRHAAKRQRIGDSADPGAGDVARSSREISVLSSTSSVPMESGSETWKEKKARKKEQKKLRRQEKERRNTLEISFLSTDDLEPPKPTTTMPPKRGIPQCYRHAASRSLAMITSLQGPSSTESARLNAQTPVRSKRKNDVGGRFHLSGRDEDDAERHRREGSASSSDVSQIEAKLPAESSKAVIPPLRATFNSSIWSDPVTGDVGAGGALNLDDYEEPESDAEELVEEGERRRIIKIPAKVVARKSTYSSASESGTESDSDSDTSHIPARLPSPPHKRPREFAQNKPEKQSAKEVVEEDNPDGDHVMADSGDDMEQQLDEQLTQESLVEDTKQTQERRRLPDRLVASTLPAQTKRKTPVKAAAEAKAQLATQEPEARKGRTPRRQAAVAAIAAASAKTAQEDPEQRLVTIVAEFSQEYDLSQQRLGHLLTTPGQDLSREDLWLVNEAWDKVLLHFPLRKTKHIKEIVKRKFDIYKSSRKWTPEDDQRLRELVEQHTGDNGRRWLDIGLAMDRYAEACRDRYRNYASCGSNRKTGKWKDADLGELYTALVTFVPQAVQEKMKGTEPPSQLEPFVFAPDWIKISKLMGNTRSRQQCHFKWQHLRVDIQKPHVIYNLCGGESGTSPGLRGCRMQVYSMTNDEVLDIIRGVATYVPREQDSALVAWRSVQNAKFTTMWLVKTLNIVWRRLRLTLVGESSTELSDVEMAQKMLEAAGDDGAGLDAYWRHRPDTAREEELVLGADRRLKLKSEALPDVEENVKRGRQARSKADKADAAKAKKTGRGKKKAETNGTGSNGTKVRQSRAKKTALSEEMVIDQDSEGDEEN